MAFDLTVTVEAIRWLAGDSPAVLALQEVRDYVVAVEKERDDAKASEAAARSALEKAQADASAMAAKLNSIVLDLADGIFDGILPDVVVEPTPAPIEEPVVNVG
jgi:hypothetical protein